MRILGVDTGGTYTDAVILERESGNVIRKSKALTTPHNLVLGIQACLDGLGIGERGPRIDLVCLSTTLATNAIVEGRGCDAGLLLIGSVPDGILPVDGFDCVRGRLDIKGRTVEPVEEKEVAAVLERMRGKHEALAISGYASVRNPAHEQAVGRMAREWLGIPVVFGHDMTMTLGFYERTVTAVLNARLIPIIQRLISAIGDVLARMRIHAPVMVVKGDGSLMRASYALERPVDTILSGPAASLIGGAFLSGCGDAMIVDIGGTTTDIAHVQNGRVRVNEEGAVVAGWRTRVRAADLHTFGLGGDSAICVADNRAIRIGPRKATPWCRAREGEENRGFTPTDVLHILGEYTEWDTALAGRGAIACGNGLASEKNVKQFAFDVNAAIIEKLDDCLQEGLRMAPLPRMVVGIGAPAGTWMRKAADWLPVPLCVPEHAEVANAVGAAVGNVLEQAEALVRRDRTEDSYIVHSTRERLSFTELEDAKDAAEQLALGLARERALKAGAEQPEILLSRDETLDENGNFLEFHVLVRALGSGDFAQ